MNKKRIFYLILSGITLLLIFGFIRTADSLIQQKVQQMEFPNKDDYWKAFYVSSKSSEKLFSNSALIIYDYDELLGWDIKSNYHTSVFCEDKTFTSNSLKIRDTWYNDDTMAKKSILFIGDSFVEGCEVSDQNTLPSLIAKEINDFVIINAGVGGYGFDQIYLKLQLVMEVFQPDIVVLGLMQGDMDRVGLSFRDYFKPYYTISGDSLELHTDHITPPDEFVKNYKTPHPVQNIWQYYSSNRSYEEDLELSQKIIAEMKAYCIDKATPFYIYNLPPPGDISNLNSFKNQKETFQLLCSAIEKEKIFDPSDYLWDLSNNFTKKEGHWDSLGNYYLAQYFVDSLYFEDILISN